MNKRNRYDNGKPDIVRGDVFYVERLTGLWCEQGGTRPAVIVSNNAGNKFSPVVEVVFLTTQDKRELPTHTKMYLKERLSTALCEQVTTVDKRRLGNYIGTLSKEEMSQLDSAMATSLNLHQEEKMKVKITSNYGENNFDIPDEKIPRLISYAADLAKEEKDGEQETPGTSDNKSNIQHEQGDKYKGFLAVKCEKCKKVKSFYARTPISYNRCDCGEVVQLKSMIPAYVDCKCGGHFKYLTNATEPSLEMKCLKCSSPVDLKMNKRGTAYVSYTI